MSDKMREEFEEWADEQGFCLDCKFFEEGNNFESPDTRMAFEIWQASRAALVVELPDSFRVNLQECFAADEVIQAIHATGVTTK